ncbi:uncharacterized protein [Argopecten irradians]|uniref:uncharacterized protein n=1 Tax=Argopecten irradians TaxID=31199 RepID=UPI00371B267B
MELTYRQQIICRWICLVLSVLGFLCYLVAFVIPYWTFIRTDGHTLRYGIFTVCIATSQSEACGTITHETVTGVFVGVQVCASIALASYFVSAVSCCLTLCWPYPWSRYFLYVCSASALTTGLFGGLMSGLYIVSHSGMSSSILFGFYMANGSLSLTCITAGFALFAGKTTTPPKANDDVLLSPINDTTVTRVTIRERRRPSKRSRSMTVSTVHGSVSSADVPTTPSDITVTTPSHIRNLLPMFIQTPQNQRTFKGRARQSTYF